MSRSEGFVRWLGGILVSCLVIALVVRFTGISVSAKSMNAGPSVQSGAGVLTAPPDRLVDGVFSRTQGSSGFCGSVMTPEQAAFELSRPDWRLQRAAVARSTPYWVPLTFHVVRRSDGTGGIPVHRFGIAMRDVNAMYAQAGIQFFRFRDGDDYYVHYIDSDSYYYGTDTWSKMQALRQESPVENTINVYYTPNISSAGDYYCGYSSFTSSSVQGILMGNSCDGNPYAPSILAHEIGHYFDLYHTHETYFGTECPDGSNCTTAGDLLCDTPADPMLSGKNSWPNCVYTGSDPIPSGCSGTYDPQVENIMSYSVSACQDYFSPEQIDKAIVTLTTLRPELLIYDQTDTDGDGIMDVIDNCPAIANADQADADWDYLGDVCDACPNDIQNDADADGICGDLDNCPRNENASQGDWDGNGIGDACGCTDGSHRWTGEAEGDSTMGGDEFGWRVADAGDVNNDGVTDIIVGAVTSSAGGQYAGRAYVYSGGDQSLLYVMTGDAAYDRLGFDVEGAGDVNNDGYADVIVGARQPWGAGGGYACVFYGGRPGPYPLYLTVADADMFFTGAAGDNLGTAVSGAGDINSDGYADLAVGAATGGYVEIRSGADGALLRTYSGTTPGDYFGYALDAAGDVNNDGYEDLIVGALLSDYAKAYSGLDGSELFHMSVLGSRFGFAVSGVGDVNDDGYADVAVGAPTWGTANSNRGRVYVYSGPVGSVLHVFEGEMATCMLGVAVDGVGDVNGDGKGDIAVGSHYANHDENFAGEVYVYSGQSGQELFRVNGENAADSFGRDLAGIGDQNGDGIGDLLVGAWNFDSPIDAAGRGRAYIYLLGDPDEDGVVAGCDLCLVKLTGDLNTDGVLTSGDIIMMVSYIFKGGAEPQPCVAVSDVNWDGTVTSADIIWLVNHVFKSGMAPFDVCAIVPSQWSCP